jgi:pilus assembly protein CpaE
LGHEDVIPVRLQIKTAETAMIFQKIIGSLTEFQLCSAEDPEAAELLILEVGRQPEKDFEVIHSLLCTDAVREVFLTSSSSDQSMLVQALRSGAREFFSQPVQEAEVTQALERYMQRREQSMGDRRSHKNGKVIDVIASKGGVGNTTIAVNLATSLAGSCGQQSVALVDMNLLCGEIPLFLDIEPAYHWGEIARNISRLDATFLMSVLHQHSSGVYVLPSPTGLDGNLEATPEIIQRLLRLMKKVFDFIIIDSGHVTEEVSLGILGMAETVLVSAILSLPCLTNVSRFLKLFYDLGRPREEQIKIVINRFTKNSDISLKDAEESISKQIFWVVPNDFKLTMSAINRGTPLTEVAPKSAVARSIREMADTFIEREASQETGSSLIGRLLGRR